MVSLWFNDVMTSSYWWCQFCCHTVKICFLSYRRLHHLHRLYSWVEVHRRKWERSYCKRSSRVLNQCTFVINSCFLNIKWTVLTFTWTGRNTTDVTPQNLGTISPNCGKNQVTAVVAQRSKFKDKGLSLIQDLSDKSNLFLSRGWTFSSIWNYTRRNLKPVA